VAEGCRKLHVEELFNLNSSPNLISVIESRRMRWIGRKHTEREMKYEGHSKSNAQHFF
jgi:hypothetical protein